MGHDLKYRSGLFDDNKPRILVTGAQGYLGSTLCDELSARGFYVVASGRGPQSNASNWAQCDLCDPSAVTQLMESCSPDIVIHAAAHVPKGAGAYADANAALESEQMLENVLLCNPACLVLISSMTVYGDRDGSVVREDDPLHPISHYAQGKRNAEWAVDRTSIPGYAIRLPGLYGAGRRDGLVYNAIKAVCERRIPALPAHPLVWAAMDVRDAARNIADLVETRTSKFTPVNVGYSGAISINTLVKMLECASGLNFHYSVIHPRFEFDLSRWSFLTGKQPVSFAEGITDLLEQFDG